MSASPPMRRLLRDAQIAITGALLLGCPPPPPPPPDAPERDAPVATDAPPSVPALEAFRIVAVENNAAFCECLPMRNPMITEARCLEINALSPDVAACEDRASAIVGGAFDAYYRCRTTALEGLNACYRMPGACTDSAVMGCGDDFSNADMACNATLPDMMTTSAFVSEYIACIEERVTGPMGACPDDATMISSATGMAVFSGSTMLAGNDSEPLPTCFPDARSAMRAVRAPDHSYRWRAPAAGRFRIDTVGSDFDTVLYVRRGCTDTTDIACSDDIALGIDQDSCVTIDAAMADEVIVVVDGFGDLGRGTFVVNITAVASDAACPTTPVTPPA